MFTSLRAGTKPYILCTTSIISIAVTICGLVTEEQIGLAFPHRKLAGACYLAALRGIYAVIFARPTDAAGLRRGVDESPKVLVNAEADAASNLPTVERGQILESSLRRCRSNHVATANVMAADTDNDVERVFGPFLTTRPNGVSKSRLAYCLVIEGRDGQPSPLSGVVGGSAFQVALPVGNSGSAQ